MISCKGIALPLLSLLLFAFCDAIDYDDPTIVPSNPPHTKKIKFEGEMMRYPFRIIERAPFNLIGTIPWEESGTLTIQLSPGYFHVTSQREFSVHSGFFELSEPGSQSWLIGTITGYGYVQTGSSNKKEFNLVLDMSVLEGTRCVNTNEGRTTLKTHRTSCLMISLRRATRFLHTVILWTSPG